MKITLTPDVEAIIQQEVDSGRFADANEVVAEAMQLFRRHAELERLRASVREAQAELERGEGEEWTPALRERLIREADEEYELGIPPDPDACP